MLVEALFILAIILAALVAVPALAHALELPGKMRLTEAEYRIVQRIYYPGFTLAGIAEVAAPLVVLALLFLLPTWSKAFGALVLALSGFIVIQGVFWLLIQPVNRFWVSSVKLSALGARFFGPGSSGGGQPAFEELRSRWEYAHLARAVLSVAALVAVVSAALSSPDVAALALACD